jgi:hypothetical protein
LATAKFPRPAAAGLRHPSRVTEALRDAHRAALVRAQGLLEDLATPADYEIVGLFQLALGERTAASTTFSTALELERKQDPASDLYRRLNEQISSLSS